MSGLPGKNGRLKKKAPGDSREPVEIVYTENRETFEVPALATSPNVLELVLRGGFFSRLDAEFAQNAEALREHYQPGSTEEHTQVDLALIALYQLRQVAAALTTAEPGDMALHRAQTLALKMFEQALDRLEALQDRAAERQSTKPTAPEMVPFLSLSTTDPERLPPGDKPPLGWDPADGDWRERIEPSPPADAKGRVWPVVKGTSMRVEEVCGILEEGWSLQCIFKAYPFLTIADIKACHEADLAGEANPDQKQDRLGWRAGGLPFPSNDP